MVAKEQACEHPDKACHGDACPLAQRLLRPPARRARRGRGRTAGWMPPAQRRIALRHGICPYYLGQELVRWADVLVGDVHHLFDPNGQLWGLMQALDWQLAVLVDEAHNLVERARQMYSAELRLAQVRARGAARRPRVRRRAGRAAAGDRATGGRRSAAPYAGAATPCPTRFVQALQTAAGALARALQPAPAGRRRRC